MNARSVVFALLLFGAGFVVSAQEAPPPSPKAKEIEALVNKAAALIDQKGKSAFPDLRKGEFLQGDTYLFVSGLDGMNLLNGGFPRNEGKNFSDLKDVNGKMIVQEQIAIAKGRGAGWLSYMWPKPGQQKAQQKWSYLRAVKIDGKPAYVGSGFYAE